MLDGIINIKKEKGYTSHDVVARLRGILGQKKIGHTGTLDPDAVGVLPVCLGKATKLCDLLTDKEKTYQTVLLLGTETDTQDISGQVLRECAVTADPAKICACIQSFQGEIMQIPPMYSACKVQGKRLYELAREGIQVERKPRPVQIHHITIIDMASPRVFMEVTCSKGTYIRTLCHDIGQKLGCGGCMEELVRTRVGTFALDQALTLDQVETLQAKGRVEEALIPIDRVLERYPKITCTGPEDKLLDNGNPLPVKNHGPAHPGWVRVCDSRGIFKGIYQQREGTGKYFPIKMFL